MIPAADRIAFVHVDVDDVWAIAACYGMDVPASVRSFVYEDALPRFAGLFAEAGIRATFFVTGRDAETPDKAARLRALLAGGHMLANHSLSHPLNFRDLDEGALDAEIAGAETAIRSVSGAQPAGFRAPGYGASRTLLRVLARRGYRYDSSLMPGPWGGVFRFLDARLRRQAGAPPVRKTQYSRLADALSPLAPHHPVSGGALLEIPAATSPLLRLPFQAGVCMRLGRAYFRANLAAFRLRPRLPLLFLFHGADLADFARMGVPFFRDSPFFGAPLDGKLAAARFFLKEIGAARQVCPTEEWIAK